MSEDRGTLKEKVYHGIYQDITNGKIVSNDILTESRISEQYGVSKAPVREALVELCKDGLLQNRPRVGYQVRQASLKEISDIIEFRVDIETSGLRHIQSRLTDKQLEELEKSILEIKGLQNEVATTWDANYKFHTILYSFNGNEYGLNELERLIKRLSICISQYYISSWKRKKKITAEHHKSIVEALKNQDIERSCRFLAEDIRLPRNDILDYYKF